MALLARVPVTAGPLGAARRGRDRRRLGRQAHRERRQAALGLFLQLLLQLRTIRNYDDVSAFSRTIADPWQRPPTRPVFSFSIAAPWSTTPRASSVRVRRLK